MKLALFFAIAIASVNAVAQEPPSAPGAKKPAPPMPVKTTATFAVVPPPSTKLSNEELAELLRAQTSAIQSLSSKLDSLEKRIGKMEKGER